MQDRMADFGNLKMFPELAWKFQLAGQNYPSEFIIYFIADCNETVEGVMASCLINPSKRQRNLRAIKKEKKNVV